MSEDGHDKDKPEVYYDGDCPMCRAFVAYADKGERHELEYRNFREEALPDGVDQQTAERQIHFVDSDGSVIGGAQAVLQVLRERGKLVWLAKLGSLPLVRNVAELVYRFIAANRFLIFGPYQKLFWIKIVLCLSFLIPLFITRYLWFGDTSRFYALTPMLPGLPPINFPLDHILWGAMMLLLVAIMLIPKARPYIIAFIALTTIYGLWDQSRWMPYNYQFVAMFLVLSFSRWDKDADPEEVSREVPRPSAPAEHSWGQRPAMKKEPEANLQTAVRKYRPWWPPGYGWIGPAPCCGDNVATGRLWPPGARCCW